MFKKRPIQSALAQAIAGAFILQSAAVTQAAPAPKPRKCVKCDTAITIGRHCARCLGTARA